MSFIFKKDINGKEVVFEVVAKPHSPNKLITASKYTGYKCSLFKISGKELSQTSDVRCYLETHQKTGPVFYLKNEALSLLEDICNTSFNKDSLYITIPELYKDKYIQMLDSLGLSQEEEEKKQRDENDKNIQEDDIIYITRSHLYIAVTYPFDSNRDTVESKLLTESIHHEELDSWVENTLAQYYVGMGCGSAQKYKMTYKDYRKFLEEYSSKLSKKSITPSI
ncbi:hypothetical protein DES36_105151 [Alkalibaculum bacchi]|uniref:Uncharacterized protein n=1 Tax=Alkalibaculum bacchi TaxID=645887 RepID=A0A366IA63_9FIRM|nr:hypothetical protein [Alkalibaculum bacchi]RBP66766.1 hypothetical protein DES36_105151 [Alkalibaculum bacchi]